MTTINQNKHFELCPICGAPVAEAHPAYGNKHGQTRPYTCGHGHLVEILYKDGEYHPRYGEDIMELLNETNIKNTRLLAIGEVASMFRVSTRTIHNWVEAEKLHPIRTSKKRGSKLLFSVDEVTALREPVKAQARAKAREGLLGLVGTFVLLTNGERDTIMGFDTDPNGKINILTRENGWFTLSGRSLRKSAPGIEKPEIKDFFIEPTPK